MATSIDLILAPREVKTVTLSEAGIIQNKNIPSGLKIGDKVVLMNEYTDVEAGDLEIENLGWTHAFLSTTGTVPPVIAAEAVYLDSVGLAIVGATNPAVGFTTNPVDAEEYTTTYSAVNPDGESILTVNPNGTWEVSEETEGSSIKITLTNKDGTEVSDSSGVHPSTLGMYTASTSDINIGSQYQLVWETTPEEVLASSDLTTLFHTTDATIILIDENGLATGVGDGFARIGATANFRGATATDQSGITVNTPVNGITDPDFTSVGASGGATASWISGNVAAIGSNATAGIAGGNAITTPATWNLMGIYNVQAANWIVTATAPTDIMRVNADWSKVTITATIPAGCTSVRFYSMRQDSVNYIYTIIPVTAGSVYKFSYFRRTTGSNIVCSLAQAIAQS